MPRTAAFPRALLKFNASQLAAALKIKRDDRLTELKSSLRALDNQRATIIDELGALGESVSSSGTSRRRGRPPGSKNNVVRGRARRGKRRGGRGRTKDSIASRTLLHLSTTGEDSVANIFGKMSLKPKQRAGLGVALSNLKKRGLLDAGGERGSWKITAAGKDAVKSIKTSD